MLVMLVLSFFSWWYGQGWIQVTKSFQTRLLGTLESFSVTQLMRTLFAPWRRIISYPGASLADRFHAWGDNLFSRVVGFVVRLFVLIAAFISVIVIAIFSLVVIVVWPLLPLAIPVCLIAGLL